MTTIRAQLKSRRMRRRGAILIAAILGFMIFGILAAALTKSLVTHSRRRRQVDRRVQSYWLAQSALSRAVHKADLDPAYQGETWRIPGDVLSDGPGEVVVSISTDAVTKRRLLSVVARYPLDDVLMTTVHKETQLPEQPTPSGDSL